MTQIIAASEYRRQIIRQLSPLGVFPVQFAGTSASGSNVISGVVGFSGLSIGQKLSGQGIPAGAYITALDSVGGNVTMSANATASASGVIVTATSTVQMTLHLFNSPPSPGPEPTPSSFQEADFDGYAAILLTSFVGPWTDQSAQAEVDAEQVEWILFADPATPNNIYGYWIDYPEGGASGPAFVYLWESFNPPQPMTVAGNGIVLVVPFTMPLPGAIDLIP